MKKKYWFIVAAIFGAWFLFFRKPAIVVPLVGSNGGAGGTSQLTNNALINSGASVINQGGAVSVLTNPAFLTTLGALGSDLTQYLTAPDDSSAGN